MTIYTVYQTTNQINGRIYVGAHKTDEPNDNYLGSGVALKRAIKKHGRKNFTKIILSTPPTREEMYIAESLIVDQEFVDDPMTYNMCLGGLGGGNGGANKGKTPITDGITEKRVNPDDIKEYLQKGWERGLSPERIKKMSKASKGKPKSPEHIKNMSGKRGADSNVGGKICINNGKKGLMLHPDVAKEYYDLNEGWTIGRGTIPINNGKKSKKVFPDVAKEYYALNEGWIPGMKPCKKSK